MTTRTDFQVSIDVQSSPAEAFDRICSVSDWWATDIKGQTRGAGSDFTVRFGETFVDFRIADFVPGETVSWYVTKCHLPWLRDQAEWTGTTVRFDIASAAVGCKITLTHVGLRPEIECFEQCSAGWTYYLTNSLQRLIQEGVGTPDRRQCE